MCGIVLTIIIIIIISLFSLSLALSLALPLSPSVPLPPFLALLLFPSASAPRPMQLKSSGTPPPPPPPPLPSSPRPNGSLERPQETAIVPAPSPTTPSLVRANIPAPVRLPVRSPMAQSIMSPVAPASPWLHQTADTGRRMAVCKDIPALGAPAADPNLLADPQPIAPSFVQPGQVVWIGTNAQRRLLLVRHVYFDGEGRRMFFGTNMRSPDPNHVCNLKRRQ